MVCGFCPGSGSAAERSFNRADVFKRHLTAAHGVEQTPPNSRRRGKTFQTTIKTLSNYAPDATGKCSTCLATFENAQAFYEHLDDCVLKVVLQGLSDEGMRHNMVEKGSNPQDPIPVDTLSGQQEMNSTREDEEEVQPQ